MCRRWTPKESARSHTWTHFGFHPEIARSAFLKFTGAAALALPAMVRVRADGPFTKRQELAMEIKRAGSQPSTKGPADWFTGTVHIDPLFQAKDPARAAGARVTFEP